MKLYDFQMESIKKMKKGCILNGSVGAGKSITSLAYYYLLNGGSTDFLNDGKYKPMVNPKRLYIITTARKRDTKEWEAELAPFLIEDAVVDSWNNIGKYKDVTDAFFIFDEQRVVGSGAWVKAFLKIARVNFWILLSATPGDSYSDYLPVFLANGFFKNKTEFYKEHCVFSRFTKYPKIDRYTNIGRLERLRNSILIDMDFHRGTIRHNEDIFVDYDVMLYKDIAKNRWNIWEDKPIETAAELCYSLRKIVNTDPSRVVALLEILEKTPRTIIFYNFDYELDLLLETLQNNTTKKIAQWNGHKHQPIPDTEEWIYLVQYTAGCEGWNCIKTNTIIFWSQNYSYKVMEQASGRIDRLNTTYIDLYYYHLKSRSGIDLAISKSLKQKKKFNEVRWVSRN